MITNLGNADGATVVVGLMSLAVVMLLRRGAPMVPGSLIAVIVGVIAVKSLDLADKGVAIVGEIDSGLPSVGLPDGIGFYDSLGAAGSAAAIMLVGFAEGSERRRPMPLAIITRSIPTRSCSGWERPTSAQVSRRAWWSTGACRRPP